MYHPWGHCSSRRWCPHVTVHRTKGKWKSASLKWISNSPALGRTKMIVARVGPYELFVRYAQFFYPSRLSRITCYACRREWTFREWYLLRPSAAAVAAPLRLFAALQLRANNRTLHCQNENTRDKYNYRNSESRALVLHEPVAGCSPEAYSPTPSFF